jgi:putative DeoR family transcriptional regulator (stage III sporulation protein D)
LKGNIEDRVIEVAKYIIENKATVRDTAKKFKISKSTVHKDVTERLEKLNPQLAEQTRQVLNVNKAERHIRGGQATKLIYKNRVEVKKDKVEVKKSKLKVKTTNSVKKNQNE